MMNETPQDKGKQVEGAPPIVENPGLPEMGKSMPQPSPISGKVVLMTEQSQPDQGPGNRMAPVPQPSSQVPPGPYPPQQVKQMQAPPMSEGYLRLHVRVDNGVMSVVDAHPVEGPLVQAQELHSEFASEVMLGAQRIAVATIADPGVSRSYPHPQPVPGEEGHHITASPTYEFQVRVPRQQLSLATLPNVQIALYRVSENVAGRPIGAQFLSDQFGQELTEVARLNGLPLETLPLGVQETLRRVLR